MTVADHLTCFGAAHCKAEAVHDVVQTALEDAQEVFAGLAGTTLCHLIVAAELTLKNAVVSLCLLLLAKLHTVLGALAAALAVLAGRSGLGAVEAAVAAGRPVVGADRDQQALAPGLMLTSIVKRADRAVFEIVKATAQGAFAGNEIITYDLANGGVDIVPPQVWARHAGVRLPAAIERRLAELRLELTRGGIRLPSLRDRTLCNCR